MIGRSFATEDAHDKIRAYVIELFEVIECEAEANLEQVGAVRRGAAWRNEIRLPEPLRIIPCNAHASRGRNCFFALEGLIVVREIASLPEEMRRPTRFR